MAFKKCSIDGQSYGDAYDDFGNQIDVTEVRHWVWHNMYIARKYIFLCKLLFTLEYCNQGLFFFTNVLASTSFDTD